MPPVLSVPRRPASEGNTPRSPENPVRLHISETGTPRAATPSHTMNSDSQPSVQQSTAELLRTTESRIAELQRLQELKNQEKELLEALGMGDKQKKRRRNDDDSDEDSDRRSHKAVNVKNITPLEEHVTFQRRREWLQDVNRAFDGDPKRYGTDTNKIIFAVDQMDKKPRGFWYSHLENLPKEERDVAKSTWSTFEKWTECCIKDIADSTSTVAKAINDAKQRDNQTPLSFHNYLDSLEAQTTQQDTKQRALLYYTKLADPIREHIDKYIFNRPEDREGMVRLATRVWNVLKLGSRHASRYGSSSNEGQGQSMGSGHGSSTRAGYRGGSGYSRRGGRQDHSTGPQHDDRWTKDHGNEGDQQTTKNNDNDNTCWICHKHGHYSYDCPENTSTVNETRGPRRGRYGRGRGSRRGNASHQQ